MRRANVDLGLLGLFLVTPHAARGQATPKLEFEVASVRPSGPQSTGPAGARQWKSGRAGSKDMNGSPTRLCPFTSFCAMRMGCGPTRAPGCSGQLSGGGSSGAVRITAQKVTLASLVGALPLYLDVSMSRIIDETGLTGNYDYRLSFSGTGLNATANADQDPTGLPDLFGALEQQLGLKLEKKKLLINVVIVDHADRVPAEN
jgi:hypothetical protein